MGAIFRREVNSYFTSPIGYIYLAAFYACAGLFFGLTALQYGSTDLSTVFSMLFFVLMVLIPILTMRTLSEDKKNKTDQCLLTAPISLASLVLGKFFAAFLIYCMGVAITVVYAVVLSAFSQLEWMLIIGNVVGLVLVGAAYIAVGIFVSSLTENQVVSAVVSFVIMVALYLINAIAAVIPVDIIQKILRSLSISERYNPFTYGVFDFSNALFFISAAVIFIYLTIRVLEKRRWA